jgi:hypothetical protein
MRLKLGILVAGSLALWAQVGPAPKSGSPPVPKNLKILSPEVNIMRVMQGFNEGLGVQCAYCHVTGDFASDANPKKEIARKMLMVVKQINMHFPDAGNDFMNSRYLPFPEGKQYVTCFTCHQGKLKPETQHPKPHMRAPEPYAPDAQGQGVPGVPAPAPGTTGAASTPDGRVRK